MIRLARFQTTSLLLLFGTIGAGGCSSLQGQNDGGDGDGDTEGSGGSIFGIPGSGATNGMGAAPNGTGAMTSGNGATGSGTGGMIQGAGGNQNVVRGECERPVSSCADAQVTVTEIDLGIEITDYGSEWDTLKLPMAIAALPSGGSRLAVLGTDGNVHLAELDCDDQLVGTPTTMPAVDLQDLHADENGGVVMMTRDATGSGEHNCGGGLLCGGTSAPCYNSLLVRFDNNGNTVWEQAVTNTDGEYEGYENGARFVWNHYQHHGRLAFDGENYAAYFCIGITVDNNSCVDVHEGDRMQVVDSSGNLVSNHPDAFNVGCSHSWTTRIVWDPRTSKFVMVCATDNDCRIAQPSPYRTVAEGECNGTLFGGDIVLSSTPGYWTAWSQDDQIRLEHFTDGASDTTITNAGDSQHPHLVSLGDNHMLLTWEAGNATTGQVRDSGTGAPIGDEFSIAVPDHNYTAWKAYSDGSAAYAAAGNSSTSVRIARVLPCD